jgi:hypothetical protein
MITNRLITLEDYSLLASSLLLDEYHKNTDPGFFYEEGTVCSVYEDENGPVCFVRGAPIEYGNIRAIQLDIQYLDNLNAKRNMRTMIEGFPALEVKAKENGFHGFFFVSEAPLLRKFCTKRLGFEEFSENVLVKRLRKNENLYEAGI